MDMTTSTITIRINWQRVKYMITVLPGMIILMSAVIWAVGELIVSNTIRPVPESAPDETVIDNSVRTAITTEVFTPSYPVRGADIDPASFSTQLPPPSLDALPYDVREPLSNGDSVPVKRRWIWVPDGQQIVVRQGADGNLEVDVPVGTIWWKEFYLETDRGIALIERRIITRVDPSSRNPDGWAYYSSHYTPQGIDLSQVLLLSSTSDEAQRFMFASDAWLPTQFETMPFEVRFEDGRGIQYPYLFPGQAQCTACHVGANGAYPNPVENPITVYGLHPNNLTPESYRALVERGWISGGDMLLTMDVPVSDPGVETTSFDTLTRQVVAVMRNNCASCHNASPISAANFTAFVVDPNHQYTSAELLDLLSVSGRMMPDAYPLVTPGQLDRSELWLRVNGLDNRRRMPPREGGLPDIDPDIVTLWRNWILMAENQ